MSASSRPEDPSSGPSEDPVAEPFKDHFSGHADSYAKSRPTYPPELFSHLATITPSRGHVWDCATGNGQAASMLADHFESVTATDASAEQIAAAKGPPNVSFRVARAEDSGLAERSVDLITVAQAAHWFDRPAFYREARRVLTSQGILALWCYELSTVDRAIDEVTVRFYEDVVGEFWPPERRLIEQGYQTLDFPFEELEFPSLHMVLEWQYADYLAYISTWSAVQRYQDAHGKDPLVVFSETLAEAWVDPEQVKTVRWPLRFRVGRSRPS